MREVSILNAFSRGSVGTNSSKKVRQEKKIPAIIYGDGKTPEPVALQKTDLRIEAKAIRYGFAPSEVATFSID